MWQTLEAFLNTFWAGLIAGISLGTALTMILYAWLRNPGSWLHRLLLRVPLPALHQAMRIESLCDENQRLRRELALLEKWMPRHRGQPINEFDTGKAIKKIQILKTAAQSDGEYAAPEKLLVLRFILQNPHLPPAEKLTQVQLLEDKPPRRWLDWFIAPSPNLDPRDEVHGFLDELRRLAQTGGTIGDREQRLLSKIAKRFDVPTTPAAPASQPQ